MAIDLGKVYPDMFEETYDSLLRDLDPVRPKERWRRIFSLAWPTCEEHVGYGLFSRGEMVGFAGYLFSEFRIDGRVEKLCNFTSWTVKERFRSESVLLLLPLRSLSDHTVTNMSPTARVREIFLRLGHRSLESGTTVVIPSPRLGGRRATDDFRIRSERGEIEGVLEGDLARIYEDHAPYGRHIVVESDGGFAYGIYTLRRRRRLRTAIFRYMSDPDVMIPAMPVIRRHLFRKDRSILWECDSRILGGRRVPASFTVRRPRSGPTRLFHSPTLPPDSVPNLYSELILLNLW
jgi:hypothetical protein